MYMFCLRKPIAVIILDKPEIAQQDFTGMTTRWRNQLRHTIHENWYA